MKIKILKKEFWYPAVSCYGYNMPYGEKYSGVLKFKNNPTNNQMTPLLISNFGRLIYAKKGFNANFKDGFIFIKEDIFFKEGLKNLKGAYLYASKNLFSKKCIDIDESLILKPIYNTWMFQPFDITQEKVLEYAKRIISLKMPKGTIIIDDKWSSDYGVWEFDKNKFKDPKKMIEKLHKLGFKVMLWVCPYVSFKASNYQKLIDKNFLLKDSKERIYKLKWWNETSACFDLRNKKAYDYLKMTFDGLIELGIDGFKFDGADSSYYLKIHNGDMQSHLWSKLASEYRFNEIRADYNNSGMSIFERLSDKRHCFGANGIASLIPSSLALSLAGHPFFAPDMIGGGEVKDIFEKCKLKKDIFLVHTQIACLLPSMQFSYLPDKVLGKEIDKFYNLMNIRKKFAPYLKKLFKDCSKTKKPMIRLLEYEFPNMGFEKVIDQFMLGEDFLVAPVTKRNQVKKKVYLGSGCWIYENRKFVGPKVLNIDCKPDKLIIFKRF